MALLLYAQLIALPPCRLKAADHSINFLWHFRGLPPALRKLKKALGYTA
jgi:hypothetical protein